VRKPIFIFLFAGCIIARIFFMWVAPSRCKMGSNDFQEFATEHVQNVHNKLGGHASILECAVFYWRPSKYVQYIVCALYKHASIDITSINSRKLTLYNSRHPAMRPFGLVIAPQPILYNKLLRFRFLKSRIPPPVYCAVLVCYFTEKSAMVLGAAPLDQDTHS
jgi:hypothetical protein